MSTNKEALKEIEKWKEVVSQSEDLDYREGFIIGLEGVSYQGKYISSNPSYFKGIQEGIDVAKRIFKFYNNKETE